MVEGRRRREAEAETGVVKGGTGGICMVKGGQIDDIDLGIDLITERRTGQERGTRIEGNGRGATIGKEMTIGHHVVGRSGVTLRICIVGREIPEIEVMIIEDEEDRLR